MSETEDGRKFDSDSMVCFAMSLLAHLVLLLAALIAPLDPFEIDAGVSHADRVATSLSIRLAEPVIEVSSPLPAVLAGGIKLTHFFGTPGWTEVSLLS